MKISNRSGKTSPMIIANPQSGCALPVPSGTVPTHSNGQTGTWQLALPRLTGLKSHSDGHLGPSLQCPTLLPFKLHSYCSAFHAEMLQQLRHAGFADPPTHQEQQRKAPFCMVVDAAKQQPVLSILQPACAQLLFCQLQLYVLAASSFNDTSCAKLTPLWYFQPQRFQPEVGGRG